MPHHERHSRRKTLIGFVTSRSGDKSVKVTIAYKTPHPLYHKIVNRQTVVHAHDEQNDARLGDRVEIMETRPLSRLKRWRITSVLERAAQTADTTISEQDVVKAATATPAAAAPADAGSTPSA